MDEIKQEVATDVASEEVVADETAAQASENTGKKKIKLPAWLQKLVDKIKSNEDVRQMVVFTLFSFICGGSQLIITLVLPALLKLAPETSVLNQNSTASTSARLETCSDTPRLRTLSVS